eukprot:6135140-Pleurochrysis_carterae.AAC.1
MAAAAGSQSPIAMTARGASSACALTASATAHAPKASAAGIESAGSVVVAARMRWVDLSAAVAAA